MFSGRTDLKNGDKYVFQNYLSLNIVIMEKKQR